VVVKRTLSRLSALSGLVACLGATAFAGEAYARIPEVPPGHPATANRTPAQPTFAAASSVPDGFGLLNRLLGDGNAYPAMAWL